ncbi:MAG: hypothetical protein LUE27_04620 [Clostridia bacterium]|nr:hypothetical protein [Clostridia bacterium]
MKKLTKGIMLAAVCVTAAAMSVGFAACGSSARMTGDYLSTNNMEWHNLMQLGGTFYFGTFSTQELKLYEDNSYVLTQTSITFSNLSVGPDVPAGSQTGNDRGQKVTTFYGSYTVTDSDSLSMTVNIATPTRIEYIESVAGSHADSDTATNDTQLTYMMIPFGAQDYFDGLKGKFGDEGEGIEVILLTEKNIFSFIDVAYVNDDDVYRALIQQYVSK